MKCKVVYALVYDKWGAKLKVPRKSHIKNPVATEQLISTFQEHVRTAITGKRCDFHNVRLLNQDESRYGVFPVVSRRITLPGIKPVGEIDYRYESVYLYGAVESLTGERFFFEISHLTGDCFQVFLNQFSVAFRERRSLRYFRTTAMLRSLNLLDFHSS
ncbi:MAG: hypothetical protein OXU23_04330 [Candidatus Poribacteria bacterium]|nr:hypothetical protein [Candidatus Poribacteria bacterium]